MPIEVIDVLHRAAAEIRNLRATIRYMQAPVTATIENDYDSRPSSGVESTIAKNMNRKRPNVVPTTSKFRGHKIYLEVVCDELVAKIHAKAFDCKIGEFFSERLCDPMVLKDKPKSAPRKVRLMLPWQSPGTERLYPVDATIEDLQ
jgi:hypothetical protein